MSNWAKYQKFPNPKIRQIRALKNLDFLIIYPFFYFTANEYLYVEPNRYVFPGAEVYDNDDESDISSRNSDSGSDTDSDDEAENSDSSPTSENNTQQPKTENNSTIPLIQNQPENIQNPSN